MCKGIVIAGTHSGVGKTTITIGILAALKKRGFNVQPFKAGPDFIDTGLHELITGGLSRNLDLWMCGRDYVMECFKKQSADADIAVVEGVMGLYDGNPSTAVLAAALDLPVILVIDAYGMAESAGAVVKGFVDFGLRNADCRSLKSKIQNPKSLIAGVIFNRVASENHYKRLKNSVKGIPVLGYLPRNLAFEIPHRHLGLIIAEENPITKKNIDKLADAVLEHIDVDRIADCGFQIADCEVKKSQIRNPKSEIRIAVACDKAFCFYYEDNLDLLRDAGGEIVTFSPLSDNKIPDNIDALYIGGGYPELYANVLGRNEPMLKAIHTWALSGKPLYAECGGLMYLSKGIYDFDGHFYKMAQVFPFETVMKKGRVNLGYREVRLLRDSILGRQGTVLRGHEFHYSEIKTNEPLPETVYQINGRSRKKILEGYSIKNTLASYVHVHFGSNPDIPDNFINFSMEI